MLVLIHFGLWGWLFLGGPYFWHTFLCVFPLVGLVSSLLWVSYVSRPGRVAHASVGEL